MGVAIAITSGKGGTGKTSITGGIAVSLARMGRNVLCIDMDIGLRNLDISLGMSDRALMDFTDVVLRGYPLDRAVAEHPEFTNLHLLSAPLQLSEEISEVAVCRLLDEARQQYDFILIDCPAGFGAGFRLAVSAPDRVLVVANSDPSSLRDAQRTVALLGHIEQVHLIMNRIQPKLLRRLRTSIDDAMDNAGLPLLGVVPEDQRVVLSASKGTPLTLGGRAGAATACGNIARRLVGEHVPIMRIR